MRRVIDDTHLTEVTDAVYAIIQEVEPADVSAYCSETYRMEISVMFLRGHIRDAINEAYGYGVITFGESRSRNEYGLGEEIELVFHTPTEQQICGRLCLLSDLDGNVACFFEDMNHNRLPEYPTIVITRKE